VPCSAHVLQAQRVADGGAGDERECARQFVMLRKILDKTLRGPLLALFVLVAFSFVAYGTNEDFSWSRYGPIAVLKAFLHDNIRHDHADDGINTDPQGAQRQSNQLASRVCLERKFQFLDGDGDGSLDRWVADHITPFDHPTKHSIHLPQNSHLMPHRTPHIAPHKTAP
jgi:hypothetical protein